MPKAVVVVPRYREKISEAEQISLTQARRVLGDWPLVFMSPERMRGYYDRTGEAAEFWPDECFSNITNYSLLMLSEKFWERFGQYEYMLLYQLDAFVFSDRLQEFMDMGYDYIGAPMPYWTGWPYDTNPVGNGGLALRNIEAAHRMLTVHRDYLYEKTAAFMIPEWAEDRLFTYCGLDKQVDFSTAPAKVAVEFSVCMDYNHAYRRLKQGWLPFGCHAWWKLGFIDIFAPSIEASGYELKNIIDRRGSQSKGLLRQLYLKGIPYYLTDMMCRKNLQDIKERIVNNVFGGRREFAVWGHGLIGHRIVRTMKWLEQPIRVIFDRAAEPGYTEDGIQVLQPRKAHLRELRMPLIVAVSESGEIITTLEGNSMKHGRDFITYLDLERAIAAEIAELLYCGKRYKWLAQYKRPLLADENSGGGGQQFISGRVYVAYGWQG